MNKISQLFLCSCFCMLFAVSATAQNTASSVSQHKTDKQEPSKVLEEEEDGPIMFMFEPDFENVNEKRKAEIAQTKSIIDTLDVSERKRVKLLRDLYKNGVSKRLQKALLAENNYEDIED